MVLHQVIPGGLKMCSRVLDLVIFGAWIDVWKDAGMYARMMLMYGRRGRDNGMKDVIRMFRGKSD
jgi:hypothetical protein